MTFFFVKKPILAKVIQPPLFIPHPTLKMNESLLTPTKVVRVPVGQKRLFLFTVSALEAGRRPLSQQLILPTAPTWRRWIFGYNLDPGGGDVKPFDFGFDFQLREGKWGAISQSPQIANSYVHNSHLCWVGVVLLLCFWSLVASSNLKMSPVPRAPRG